MEQSYSEQMLTALENEDLVAAQLAFNQALVKDQPEELAQLGEQLLQLGFWKKHSSYLSVL